MDSRPRTNRKTFPRLDSCFGLGKCRSHNVHFVFYFNVNQRSFRLCCHSCSIDSLQCSVLHLCHPFNVHVVSLKFFYRDRRRSSKKLGVCLKCHFRGRAIPRLSSCHLSFLFLSWWRLFDPCVCVLLLILPSLFLFVILLLLIEFCSRSRHDSQWGFLCFLLSFHGFMRLLLCHCMSFDLTSNFPCSSFVVILGNETSITRTRHSVTSESSTLSHPFYPNVIQSRLGLPSLPKTCLNLLSKASSRDSFLELRVNSTEKNSSENKWVAKPLEQLPNKFPAVTSIKQSYRHVLLLPSSWKLGKDWRKEERIWRD